MSDTFDDFCLAQRTRISSRFTRSAARVHATRNDHYTRAMVVRDRLVDQRGTCTTHATGEKKRNCE